MSSRTNSASTVFPDRPSTSWTRVMGGIPRSLYSNGTMKYVVPSEVGLGLPASARRRLLARRLTSLPTSGVVSTQRLPQTGHEMACMAATKQTCSQRNKFTKARANRLRKGKVPLGRERLLGASERTSVWITDFYRERCSYWRYHG